MWLRIFFRIAEAQKNSAWNSLIERYIYIYKTPQSTEIREKERDLNQR